MNGENKTIIIEEMVQQGFWTCKKHLLIGDVDAPTICRIEKKKMEKRESFLGSWVGSQINDLNIRFQKIGKYWRSTLI